MSSNSTAGQQAALTDIRCAGTTRRALLAAGRPVLQPQMLMPRLSTMRLPVAGLGLLLLVLVRHGMSHARHAAALSGHASSCCSSLLTFLFLPTAVVNLRSYMTNKPPAPGQRNLLLPGCMPTPTCTAFVLPCTAFLRPDLYRHVLPSYCLSTAFITCRATASPKQPHRLSLRLPSVTPSQRQGRQAAAGKTTMMKCCHWPTCFMRARWLEICLREF
jgi:hypothetical protein